MTNSMRYFKLTLQGVLLFLIFFIAISTAQAAPQNKTVIYFFWGDGCPHCAAAKPFLEELNQSYPGVELRAYEVWNSTANQKLFMQLANAKGFEPSGVPTIIIGERYWVGYNDKIRADIEAAVQVCSEIGCPDAGVGIVPEAVKNVSPHQPIQPVPSPDEYIDVPLIGRVDLAGQSLFISTLLIAFVDGVNPCSIWVLSMLLTLTLHTNSRRKVVTIGLVFLTVTAAVYALFIAGLFTVLSIVSFVGWIQIIVSLLALFFGIVNVKDYFWYKEGISFTIADEKKPGIFQRMRRLMDASQSFGSLIGATFVLSAGVSLVEFSCTAGFPVLWTNLLTAQKVTALTFILLLLVYMVIYQLDEMVIFFSAVFTLRSNKMEEKHGRLLKLIGGMLMLALSAVMLINPAIMNQLSSSLIVFGIAFAATLLVLLVHRVILPRFGIWIGTELENSGGRRQKKNGE